MTTTAGSLAPIEGGSPLWLDVGNVRLQVTPEHFDQLCRDNPDLRLELTQDGELRVMAPTGGERGRRNLNLAVEVGLWNRQTNLGEAFDSSTGYDFTALGGGKLSPDISWIEKSRLVGVDIYGRLYPSGAGLFDCSEVMPGFVLRMDSIW